MNKVFTKQNFIKWAPLLVLLALILLFSIWQPNFFSLRNFSSILRNVSPALMVAVGVTFVILLGSIDLSMEGTVSVTAVVFALTFISLGGTLANPAVWLSFPAALLAGALLGWINAMVHIKLRIPSFMASLAMGFIGTGLAMMITGGDRIRVEDPIFRSLLTVRWLGFPIMVYVAAAGFLVAVFIQSRMRLGRNFYAVGGGEALAHASGMKVNRVRIWAFTLAGIFFALGAILAVARIGIAETTTGANYMFVSITSVVVGGTALWGGIGGVWNTLIGVLIVGVINNGMTVVGLPDYLQDGVLGVLVIVAVVLSTDRKSVSFVK